MSFFHTSAPSLAASSAPTTIPPQSQLPDMSSTKSCLVSGAAHLFNNDQFSDLKIKCEDLLISAHKLVICTPSDVLYAMCTAGFRESASNIIDLSDDTKGVVYRMVEFLYRGDYTELEPPDYQTTDKDSHGSNLSAAPHAILHAAMFAVADKYNIAALGDVAKNKFEQAIKESVSDTNYFLDIIDYVYSTTPESNRGLRDLIVFQAQTRGAKIMAEPELNSRLEEIISSTPRFAMDLIQQSLHPASPPSPKRCPFCTAVMGNEANCSQCKNGTARLPWNFDRLRDPQGTHGGGGLFGNANANAHPPGSTVGDFASLLANPRSNNGLSTNTDAILHANEQISIDLF